MNGLTDIFLVFLSFFALSSAFVVPNKNNAITNHATNVNSLQKLTFHTANDFPPVLNKQRKSIAHVQAMGLFGLGGAEIAVIVVLGVFLLGPQKISELGRQAGRASSDFKDIPKEFQKGLEEGEIEARSNKAKEMDNVDEITGDTDK